jgi:site-specific DNA-methyltransferase (adenine-specific)
MAKALVPQDEKPEKAGVILPGRSPDVLTCIANLSNDEVFTSPALANQMLDTVAASWANTNNAKSIWSDRTATFLDPFTKSGVFLRQITSRLVEGLQDEIPDLQERVNHILTKQVFGIGITQLTAYIARRSLYCSKFANGPHSIVTTFGEGDGYGKSHGHVWFERLEHTWNNDKKCRYCPATQSTLDRGSDRESHAYALTHTDDVTTRVAEILGADMKFDVIIGNPPYQLQSDGGTRDVPIYQKFVEQAKKLEPRLLTMIIPSRWMATGLGLNEFRRTMLDDKHLRKLVDYERMDDVFPGVDFEGGVGYFLWDHDNEGLCAVTSISGGEVIGPVDRVLGEFDILVRDSRALSILRKVARKGENSITEILSVDKEFGWTSNFSGFHKTEKPGDVELHYNRSGKRLVGYINRKDITKSAHLIDKWKVMVPKAYGERGARPAKILGPTLIAKSPCVCTQTYLFFFVDDEASAESLSSYARTRFFRFLVSLRKITQDAARATYTWVPIQAWDRKWTDEALYKKYGLINDEIAFIESMIRPMDPSDE